MGIYNCIALFTGIKLINIVLLREVLELVNFKFHNFQYFKVSAKS